MKFKDTLLHATLVRPIELWKSTNPYSFALLTPYLLVHFVIGVPLAIIMDMFCAHSDMKD